MAERSDLPELHDDESAAPARAGEPLRPETRRERVARKAHQTRAAFQIALLVIAAVILVALVASNTRRVKISWVVGDTRTSLVWIMLASAVLGWVLGTLTTFVVRRRVRKRIERVVGVREQG